MSNYNADNYNIQGIIMSSGIWDYNALGKGNYNQSGIQDYNAQGKWNYNADNNYNIKGIIIRAGYGIIIHQVKGIIMSS